MGHDLSKLAGSQDKVQEFCLGDKIRREVFEFIGLIGFNSFWAFWRPDGDFEGDASGI